MTKNEYEQNIARAMAPLDNTEIEEAIILIETMINLSVNRSKYIMLLSRELNYYTIFHIENALKTTKGLATDIMKFLTDDTFLKEKIGSLKLVEDNIDNDHIEIWIGETYFSLFICDDFIVNL